MVTELESFCLVVYPVDFKTYCLVCAASSEDVQWLDLVRTWWCTVLVLCRYLPYRCYIWHAIFLKLRKVFGDLYFNSMPAVWPEVGPVESLTYPHFLLMFSMLVIVLRLPKIWVLSKLGFQPKLFCWVLTLSPMRVGQEIKVLTSGHVVGMVLKGSECLYSTWELI